MNLVHPIFFAENGVRRGYSGGMLLQRFRDDQIEGQDGDCPEEWLASTTPVDEGDEEGLSYTLNPMGEPVLPLADLLDRHAEALLGPQHVETFGPTLGFDCRLMDFGEAAPVHQDHPGGVEAWTILATREIDEEAPSVRVCADGQHHRSRSLFARPGETYFFNESITATEAIGLFVLSVRPRPLHVDLSPEGESDDEDLFSSSHEMRMEEHLIHRSDQGLCAETVGTPRTRAFTQWRIEVAGRYIPKIPAPFALMVCVAGSGHMYWAGDGRDIHRGDVFLQPYGVPWIEYTTPHRMSLITVLPPTL